MFRADDLKFTVADAADLLTEITLGDVTVARVEEMHGSVGMTPEQFFPGWPGRDWQQNRDWLVPNHLSADDDIVQVAFQTWALRSEGRTILVDTGIGNGKTRPAVAAWDNLSSGYLRNLASAGISPEDVDLVINTRLHVDRIGWNTRLDGGQWVPTFPNATYLMPRLDFEHFDPAKNPDIAGGVNENAFQGSVEPVLAAGQVELWEGERIVDGNPAAGRGPRPHTRLRRPAGRMPFRTQLPVTAYSPLAQGLLTGSRDPAHVFPTRARKVAIGRSGVPVGMIPVLERVSWQSSSGSHQLCDCPVTPATRKLAPAPINEGNR